MAYYVEKSVSLFDDSEEETTNEDDSGAIPKDSSLIGLTSYQRSLIKKGGNTLKGDVVGMDKQVEDECRYANHSYAKAGHTKACNKIRRLIASGVANSTLRELRQQLKYIARELLYHHELWYKSPKSKTPAEKESIMDWLSDPDDTHLQVTSEIQIYLDRIDTSLTQEEAEHLQTVRDKVDKDKSEMIEMGKKMSSMFNELATTLEKDLKKPNSDSVSQSRPSYSRLNHEDPRSSSRGFDMSELCDDDTYQPFSSMLGTSNTAPRHEDSVRRSILSSSRLKGTTETNFSRPNLSSILPTSSRGDSNSTLDFTGRPSRNSMPHKSVLFDDDYSIRRPDFSHRDHSRESATRFTFGGRDDRPIERRGGPDNHYYKHPTDSFDTSLGPRPSVTRSTFDPDRHYDYRPPERRHDYRPPDDYYGGLPPHDYGWDPLIHMLPKTVVPIFDGDPMKWPSFISAWRNLIHTARISDAHKLSLLQQYLTTKVKQELGIALYNPHMYNEVMATLKAYYGMPELVATRHLDTVLTAPAVAEGDRQGLMQFILNIRSAVAVLNASDGYSELNSKVVLRQVVSKLPHSSQVKWITHTVRHPEAATLYDLAVWLQPILQTERLLGMSRSPTARHQPKAKDDSNRSGGNPGAKQPKLPYFLAMDVRDDDGGTSNKKPPGAGQKGDKNSKSPPKKNTPPSPCFVCDQPRHSLFKCEKFLAMSVDARVKLGFASKRCLCCFSDSHKADDCTSTFRCRHIETKGACGGKHHTLIHGYVSPHSETHAVATGSSVTPKSTAKPAAGGGGGGKAATHLGICTLDVNTSRKVVLMAVVKVRASANGRTVETYALLDYGANSSLIRSDLAKALRIPGTDAPVQFFNAFSKDTVITREGTFEVNVAGSPSFQVTAYTTPHINMDRRTLNWELAKETWKYLPNDIPPPVPGHCQIGLLLGMDVAVLHVQSRFEGPPPGQDGPVAIQTPLGWCVVGSVPIEFVYDDGDDSEPIAAQSPAPHYFTVCRTQTEDDDDGSDDSLHRIVHQFICIENLGTKPNVAPVIPLKDQKALDFAESSYANKDSICTIGLPWARPNIVLPDNKEAVLRHFFRHEKKFVDPDYAVRYHASIMKNFEKGFARKLSEEEVNRYHPRTWYLRHHGVIKSFKPQSLRAVMDATYPHLGSSLNGSLLQGPNLMNEMIDVLFLFRLRQVAVSGDITAFFHKVKVPVEDQPALRYFHRQPGSKVPPDVYQFTSHPFGLISSMFIATFALRKVAEERKEEFVDAAVRVDKNFYVDNYLDSFDTEEEAHQLVTSLVALLSKGDFHLCQWLSNSRNLLTRLPAADLLQPELDLDFDQLPEERTLGVQYRPQKDVFAFKFLTRPPATTKRQILSHVAGIADQNGFLIPVTVPARALLQSIWISGTGWDEPVIPEILEQWKKWSDELSAVELLEIPRLLVPPGTVSISIHGFGDASEIAYAAVVYIRCVNEAGDIYINFIAAKAKVAPVRPLTIPRLELLAALINFRLVRHYTDILQRQYPSLSIETTYWSDSQVTLHRIHSRRARFCQWLSNRLGEILEGSSSINWRWCPTLEMPADHGSRGIEAPALTIDHQWFKGPEFLRQSPESWPKNITPVEPTIEDDDVRPPVWVGLVSRTDPRPVSDFIQNSSELPKLVVVVGRVLRFIRNCRSRISANAKPRVTSNYLFVSELKEALNTCIRLSQTDCLREERWLVGRRRPVPPESKLSKLTPFLDDDGILRVGGRIGRSIFSHERKHPTILGSHHLTNVIIRHHHLTFGHGSTERVLGELRDRYFIIGGRRAVNSVVSRCSPCERWKAKPKPPQMAPLPPCRITPQHPFNTVGTDFLGPFYVTVKRSTEKRYAMLTTDLVCRAVHLEKVYSMSADSFIMAHRRFCADRGVPSEEWSDNGTNMVGGQKEMADELKLWDQTKIRQYMQEKGTEWNFLPPGSPWMGGAHESLVKSCKNAIHHVLGNQTLTDEMLDTVLKEVAALLNSRPLTHLSVDPEDPEPLTPNHFLFNRAQPYMAPGVFSDPSEILSRRRWRRTQVLIDQIWRRWMKEYLPTLIERKKWLYPTKPLTVGDIVLLADPNTPRGVWPLGRITSAYPGSDGIIRVATVKTKTGTYLRPVAKMCLLEAHKSADESSLPEDKKSLGK